MSAADYTHGPLARAAVDSTAETEEHAGYGRIAQEACDKMEARLERKKK
jgi:hypothetical protein